MSRVTDLFTTHGVENAELIAGIEQLLTTAESKNTDGIPKGRFNEVVKERNELRADIEELNAKISGYETKLEASKEKLESAKAVQNELDEFKHAAFKEKRELWVEKAKLFNVAEDDKKYPDVIKIKDDFVFCDNIDDYKESDIVQNLNMLKPYEKIGYFGDSYVPPDIDDKRSQGGSNETIKDPLDELDG